eukprot:6172156-Pleurochrysis_carterae.AAC.1
MMYHKHRDEMRNSRATTVAAAERCERLLVRAARWGGGRSTLAAHHPCSRLRLDCCGFYVVHLWESSSTASLRRACWYLLFAPRRSVCACSSPWVAQARCAKQESLLLEMEGLSADCAQLGAAATANEALCQQLLGAHGGGTAATAVATAVAEAVAAERATAAAALERRSAELSACEERLAQAEAALRSGEAEARDGQVRVGRRAIPCGGGGGYRRSVGGHRDGVWVRVAAELQYGQILCSLIGLAAPPASPCAAPNCKQPSASQSTARVAQRPPQSTPAPKLLFICKAVARPQSSLPPMCV